MSDMDIFFIYRSAIDRIQLVSVFVYSNIFLLKTVFCFDKMKFNVLKSSICQYVCKSSCI